MRTPPEKFGGVFHCEKPHRRHPRACPEDLLPLAAGGEVEGGDATADARHKAEHDGSSRLLPMTTSPFTCNVNTRVPVRARNQNDEQAEGRPT